MIGLNIIVKVREIIIVNVRKMIIVNVSEWGSIQEPPALVSEVKLPHPFFLLFQLIPLQIKILLFQQNYNSFHYYSSFALQKKKLKLKVEVTHTLNIILILKHFKVWQPKKWKKH